MSLTVKEDTMKDEKLIKIRFNSHVNELQTSLSWNSHNLCKPLYCYLKIARNTGILRYIFLSQYKLYSLYLLIYKVHIVAIMDLFNTVTSAAIFVVFGTFAIHTIFRLFI